MSAHTPGPWSCELVNVQHSISCKSGPIAYTRCLVSPQEDAANARLIAAAPDMYAVLRELSECSQYWSEYDVPIGIHDRIAAALAKASGQ